MFFHYWKLSCLYHQYYIIKIISILIRRIEIRQSMQEKFQTRRDFDWSDEISCRMNIDNILGNWFSIDKRKLEDVIFREFRYFPKRVLEGWSVESASGRGRCIRTWQCGQCYSHSYQHTPWAVGHGILTNVNHTGKHAPPTCVLTYTCAYAFTVFHSFIRKSIY